MDGHGPEISVPGEAAEPGQSRRRSRSRNARKAWYALWVTLAVAVIAWAGMLVVGRDNVEQRSGPPTISPRDPSLCGSRIGAGTTATSPPLPSPATALDIAKRLPEAIKGPQDPLATPDSAGERSSPMLTEHLRSAATGSFFADRIVAPFSFGVDMTGDVTVLVYDTPADRLAAEQANPPGEQAVPTDKEGTSYDTDLRCFADCGPVAIEVSLLLVPSDTTTARQAFQRTLADSRAGLKSLFGACPASEDTTDPPTVGSWPAFATPPTRLPPPPPTQSPRQVCVALQRGEVPAARPVDPGRGCELHGVDLTGADLSGADLTGAFLYEANLSGANLQGATLRDLKNVNLTGANLTGANLEMASTNGANLTNANLTGANLRHSYLYRANLAGARLTGADLTSADLTETNLTGADLTGATLTDAFGKNTTCPDGFTSEGFDPSTCVGHGI